MKKLLYTPLIFICITAFSLLYASFVQNNLSDNLLRMHIIANSDSERDQQIKLQVRDKILGDIDNTSTIESLKETANEILHEVGADYAANVCLERSFVPEKSYKDIRLPEGQYTCLKVILGSGNGKNWWCVAYPPLCFTEDMFGGVSSDGRKQLEAALDNEALKTIVNNGDVNFRFKIVEEMQKLRYRLAG